MTEPLPPHRFYTGVIITIIIFAGVVSNTMAVAWGGFMGLMALSIGYVLSAIARGELA